MKTDETIPPLLLYSMSEFSPLIEWLLQTFQVRSVVEIGAEYGQLTEKLIDDVRSGKLDSLTIIDPDPKTQIRALFQPGTGAPDGIHFLQEPSLSVLPEHSPADCYIIDGDHNYYTVLHELLAIEKTHGNGTPFPLILLHDVGWPCSRRDQYYAPQDIPAEWRHDHDFHLGTTLQNDSLVPGGFRSNGLFAFAKNAGGPRNGVLTAVDDFLASRGHIRFHMIPAIFGLGILYPETAPPTLFDRPEFSRLLEQMLSKMENNRLALYLKVLELQDQLQAEQQEVARLKAYPLLRPLIHWLHHLLGKK